MKKFLIICFVLFGCGPFISATKKCRNANGKKNVLFILCDDLGFNDPSFRGNNEITTPNIDALFYKGVALNRYYTNALCTPSRAALLTGRYAHHVGMQNDVTWQHQPWGLGLDQKLMSEYFREAGYATHIIGKWHLGHHQDQYLPTFRGFDTHFGYDASPFIDYFKRTSTIPHSNFGPNNFTRGYDFKDNLEIYRDDEDMYVTDLLTKRAVTIIESDNEDKPFFLYLAHLAMHRANDDAPLQAKPDDYELYSYIENERRRTYAAMVKSLDDSVGEVVDALKQSGKLDDTIIVFTTDNGGPTAVELTHPNSASNYPLKGMKGTSWEGGIRVDCVIYAPFLPSGVVRENLFHVSDWLPTLNTLAGAKIKFDRYLDGLDLSKMIQYGFGPFRTEVETIDQVYKTTSFISGKYKLVNSTFTLRKLEPTPDDWLGSNDNINHDSDTYIEKVLNSKVAKSLNDYVAPLAASAIQQIRSSLKLTCTEKIVECNITERPCLFNINEDPCERINLADDPKYEQILKDMKQLLAARVADSAMPRNIRTWDYASDPSNFEGIWRPWQENVKDEQPTVAPEKYKIIYNN